MDEFSHLRFPTEPEFYRRVLEYAPTPLLVVDRHANIVYANRAMLNLGSWDLVSGRSALDYVHPEDRAQVADAFTKVTENPAARILGRRTWSEIHVRVLAADGRTVHVEINGTGAMLDDAVGGMIYSVRPATARHLLGRILDDLSNGASIHQMLSRVSEMIALPPLDLDAVILQSTPANAYSVVASTSPAVADVLRRASTSHLWDDVSDASPRVSVEHMPPAVRDRLSGLGYQMCWSVAVESPLTPTKLRIIAAAPTPHDPDGGVLDRLFRAREVASAILLRTQTDVLLEYAAAYDLLTALPNRPAFYQQTEGLDLGAPRAVLHLNLDGLHEVNAALGQAAGDAVLEVVADRLRALCRDDDLIGRIGGDEFSIVLVQSDEQLAVRQQALDLASQVRQALTEPIIIAGQPLHMSTSIGVAFAEAGVSTGQLLAWADSAVQNAKTGGGDRIVTFGVNYG